MCKGKIVVDNQVSTDKQHIESVASELHKSRAWATHGTKDTTMMKD